MRRTLILGLWLAVGCVERPTPVDTETASTSPTSDPTTTEDPTGGSTGGSIHAGPCSPAKGGACADGFMCCSDDPATVGGKLPNYSMDGVTDETYGTPLFSDINNALSYWGYCIDTSEFLSPLVNGCPVPCNPTWDPAQVTEICAGGVCCPFTAVDPEKDCILDPDSGRWRTARGSDVIAMLTSWGTMHTTNQDPFAESCTLLAQGSQSALIDCITQLTVADQRGFCLSVDCPCVEDVCDMKNSGWTPRCS